MILCRNGHENQDDATVCAVCGAAISGAAEEEAPAPAPVQPRISLSAESLTVAAGGEGVCEVRVENPGQVSATYELAVLGDAVAFATVEPQALTVAAGANATATLTFRPPASASGLDSFEVRATSKQLPEESPASAVGLVQIAAPAEQAPATGLSAELRPPVSKARSVGRHELLVHNATGAAAGPTPTGSDPNGAVDVAVDPPTLTITPGQSAVAQLRVTPRRRLWLGKDRTFPFQVSVTPDVAVDGALIQQPRLPLPLVLVLAAAVVVLAIVVPLVASSSGGDGCQAAQLNATFSEDPGGAGAGHVVYILRLRNISSGTCSVSGLVGMQLAGPTGDRPTQVVPAGDPGNATEVTLAPGGFASTSVRFVPSIPGPGEGSPCQPTSDRVRVVVPPARDGSALAPVTPPTSVCLQGRLEVMALVAGPSGSV